MIVLLCTLMVSACGGPSSASQPLPTSTPTLPPTPTSVPKERLVGILGRVIDEKGINPAWSDDIDRFELLRWTMGFAGASVQDLESMKPVVLADPDRPGVWVVELQFTIAGEQNVATWHYFEEDDRVVPANDWARLVDRG